MGQNARSLATKAVALSMLVGVAISGLPAQTPAGGGTRLTLGQFTFDFVHGHYEGRVLHGFDGVHLQMAPADPATSTGYDVTAETLTVEEASGKPSAGQPFPIARATAEGDPKTGKQVVGRFTDVLNSQSYRLLADRAVYLPDASRPNGGSVTFTGHVKLYTTSGFLAEPSVTTVTKATVLLGTSSREHQYPAIDFDDLHSVVTPAQ